MSNSGRKALCARPRTCSCCFKSLPPRRLRNRCRRPRARKFPPMISTAQVSCGRADGSFRKWSCPVWAYIPKTPPFLSCVLPNHKIIAQHFDCGWRLGIEVVESGERQPAVGPHESVGTTLGPLNHARSSGIFLADRCLRRGRACSMKVHHTRRGDAPRRSWDLSQEFSDYFFRRLDSLYRMAAQGQGSKYLTQSAEATRLSDNAA